MSTWPPRIMENDVAESKYDAPGRMVTVSLPGVDQVRIDLAINWVGPDAKNAVFRLQHHLDASGNVVGHEGRQSDT